MVRLCVCLSVCYRHYTQRDNKRAIPIGLATAFIGVGVGPRSIPHMGHEPSKESYFVHALTTKGIVVVYLHNFKVFLEVVVATSYKAYADSP